MQIKIEFLKASLNFFCSLVSKKNTPETRDGLGLFFWPQVGFWVMRSSSGRVSAQVSKIWFWSSSGQVFLLFLSQF